MAYTTFMPQLLPDKLPQLLQNNTQKLLPYTLPMRLPYNVNRKYINYDYTPPKRSMFNYNDPNEVNSMSDVLLKSLNRNKNDNNPLGTMIGGTWDLLKRGTLDPIRAGNFGTAAVNNLINFAETMDIVAAPTKALLQGYGVEGAKNALGFGIEGRKNYDWHTGNLLANFVLEVVSDPINWVTLGVKAVVVGTTTAGIKAGVKTVAKDIGAEMSDRVYRKIAKQATESFLKGDTVAFAENTANLMRNLESTGKLKFVKPVDKPLANIEDFMTAFTKAEQIAKEGVGYTINKSLYKLTGAVSSAERGLLRMALSPSIYPQWWVAKHGFNKAYSMIDNRIKAKMKPYLRPDETLSFTDFPGIMNMAKESQTTFEMMQDIKLQPGDVPKYYLQGLLQGVKKDTEAITKIFQENGEDVEAIKVQIKAHMQEYNKVDSIEEYLETLNKVNDISDGYFDTATQIFESHLKQIEDIEAYLTKKNIDDTFSTTMKNMNDFQVGMIDRLDFSELQGITRDRSIIHHKIKQVNKAIKSLEGTTDPKELVKLKELLQHKDAYRAKVKEIATTLQGSLPSLVSGGFYGLTHPGGKSIGELTSANAKAIAKTLYQNTLSPYFVEVKQYLDTAIANFPPEVKQAATLDYGLWVNEMKKSYQQFIKDATYSHSLDGPIAYMNFPAVLYSLSNTEKAIQNANLILNKNKSNIKREMKEFDTDGLLNKLVGNLEDSRKTAELLDTLFTKNSIFLERTNKETRVIFAEDSLKEIQKIKSQVVKLNNDMDPGLSGTMEVKLASAYNDFIVVDPNSAAYADAFFELQKQLRYSERNLARRIKQTTESFDTPRKNDFDPAYAKKLDDILTQLDGVTPFKIEEAKVTLSETPIVVRMQTERLNASLDLSVRGNVGDFLGSIKNGTTAEGRFIRSQADLAHNTEDTFDEMQKAVIATASEIDKIADINLTYKDFLLKLAGIKKDVSEPLKQGVLATIQSFGHKAPEAILNEHAVMDEFFDRLQVHMIAQHSSERYNLQMVRETIDDWGKDLPDALKLEISEGHTSRGDVLALREWLKAKHPDVLERYNPDTVMIADIETTGLNKWSKEVLEISYTKLDGTTETFVQRMPLSQAEKIMADNEVLATLFNKLPTEQHRKAFIEKYVAKPGEAPVFESDLLRRFLDHSKANSINNGGAANTYIFHNGNSFDYRFLDERFRQHGIDTEEYARAVKDDSFADIVSKNENLTIAPAARARIEDAIKEFARGMSALDCGRLIDNRTGQLISGIKTLRSIYETAVKVRKTAEAERKIPQQPTDLYNDMQAIAGSLQDTEALMVETLKSVGRNNMAFNQSYLVDIFKSSTPETRMEFIRTQSKELGITPTAYREKFGYNAEMVHRVSELLDMTPEAIYKEFGDNLNLPRLLNFNTPLGSVAYKKVIEKDLLMNYFHVDPNVPNSLKLMQAMTTVSKYISKDAGYVKNPYSIYQMQGIVDSSLRNLHNMVDVPLYKALRADNPNGLNRFMTLKYLYNHFAKPQAAKQVKEFQTELAVIRNLKDPVSQLRVMELQKLIAKWTYDGEPWHPGISPKLQDLLVDPKGIYKSTLYDVATCTDEVIARRTMEELISNATAFYEYTEQQVRHTLNLEKLGREIDNELWASEMYAIANAQKPVIRLLRKIQGLAQNEKIINTEKQHTMSNLMGTTQIKNLLEDSLIDPRHLRSTLVWDSPVIHFALRQAGDSKHLDDLLEMLLTRSKEFEDLGIKFYKGQNTFYAYLDLVKNKLDATIVKDKYRKAVHVRTLGNVEISMPTHRALAHPALLSQEYLGDLQSIRSQLDTLTNGKSVGNTGELITPTKFKDYFDKLPEDIQKSLGSIDDLTAQKFWKGIKCDWTNIGTVESKKLFDQYANTTVLQTYKNALQYSASIAESKALYTSLYFDSAMSINVGNLATEGLSVGAAREIDQSLVDALGKSDEFILAALVADNAKAGNGYRVVQLTAKTPEDIQFARTMNATVVPYQVYATSHQTLNTGMFDSTVLNFWHKIIYAYKIGYLLDPGVVMRNMIDSTSKNIVSQDAKVARVAKTQVVAMRLLNKYNTALKDILALNQDVFTHSNVAKYFEQVNKDTDFTLEQFKYVHGFIVYSASAGLTGPWQKYLKNKNFGMDEKSLWGTFVSFSDMLMTPNKYIEQINRMTQYIMLEEDGFTKTKIFHEIARTHFDYNIKTKADMYAELLFPFYTFTMRNMEFWIDAVMNRPWLASMFKDIMTPVWNFDGLPSDELARNRSLQYQILSGNLPLNDKGLTLKVNPSYMDVYNIMADIPNSLTSLAIPGGDDMQSGAFNTITSKLAAPLQVALDETIAIQGGLAAGLFDTSSQTLSGQNSLWNTVLANLPVVGATKTRYDQGAKYAERTGSEWQALPGLQGTFGGTQRWEPMSFRPKSYKASYAKAKSYSGKKSFRSNKATKAYYDSGSPSGQHWDSYPRRYYPTHTYYQKHYYDSFYSNHYSKSGKSKMDFRMTPYTPENLEYRIKDLHYYFQ